MEYLWWSGTKQREQITRMRQDKENVELQLCKTLYEIFSEEPLLQVIQLLAHYAILDVYDNAYHSELRHYLGKSCGKYRLWKLATHRRWQDVMLREPRQDSYHAVFGRAPDKFDSELKSMPQADPRARGGLLFHYLRLIKDQLLTWLFDPGDCMDILTMYGEFVEESAERKSNPEDDYPVSRKTFAHGFKGVSLDELRAKKRKVSKDQKQFFRLFKEEVVDFFSKKKYRKRDDLIAVGRQSEFDKKLKQLIDRAYLITPGVVPGLARFRLGGESSLKQVDKMFGLRKGGDISGTTADTIFAIEALLENFRVDERRPGMYRVPGEAAVRTLMKRAGYIRTIENFMDDVQKIREILCLLPVASMGYQGHHTILECAVTLTMNDYTDYQLGLYTTLLPRAWWRTKTREGEVYKEEKGSESFERVKKEIRTALGSFETRKENHWMVLSFSGIDSEPVMCIVFEKNKVYDRELFRLLSWLSMNAHVWLDRMYHEDKSKRYADQEMIKGAVEWWKWWKTEMEETGRKRSQELRAMPPRGRCPKHPDQEEKCPICDEEL